MRKPPQIPDIALQEQTPTVKALLELLEQFALRIAEQDEEIAQLKDEINILKGEKKRPTFKPSALDKSTDNKPNQDDKKNNKRAGSEKKSKTAKLTIHSTPEPIAPSEPIPQGSRFKGYREFVVQDLIIRSHNTRYRLERWVTAQGETLRGELPPELRGRHFGPELIRFVLYQHHHCQTTQPLLLEQLREYGVDISAGQIERILSTGHEQLHAEKDALLQAGLEVSDWVNVDDSGARHKGKNGFVTHIGNEWFAWFKSTPSKSRLNFLDLLRAGAQDYSLSSEALDYMQQQKLPLAIQQHFLAHKGKTFENTEQWTAFLSRLGIDAKRHCQIATEGALLGCVLNHGMCDNLVILSDGARQFDILQHALCWIHTERLVHKTLPLNESHQRDIDRVRDDIWALYADLKAYRLDPQAEHKPRLSQRFDEIFSSDTSYQTLNRLLQRTRANKDELLLVLERPDIPLHTNGSETDIRDYVKKKKVSGGTRSDEGQKCRDTFATQKKSCRKLGISFWGFLGDRLGVLNNKIPSLSDLVRERAAAQT